LAQNSISIISFTPSSTYEQALGRAADRFGIEREYWDIWGKHHQAPPETISGVLGALGIDAADRERLDRAVEAHLLDEWSRLAPATLVASVNQPVLTLRTPAGYTGTVDIAVAWEGGGESRATVELAGAEVVERATIGGREFTAWRVKLPFPLGLGYHELTMATTGAETTRTRWILCPDRAYLPEPLDNGGRGGGIAISLYAIRSGRNWGCGDFTDLKGFVEWSARELEVSMVGLNPLHALANRVPYNTSPYLPLCAFYKNLIYLDVEAIEDFKTAAWAQRIVAGDRVQTEIRALRDTEFVGYERVQRLKLRVLRQVFRTFLDREYRRNTPRAQAFRHWVEREGTPLHTFAVYSALDAAIHRANPNIWLWCDWPDDYRDPHSEGTRRFAAEHWRSVLFFKYIQWQIDIGLEAASARAGELGMEIGLYHDLALATDRFGADLWAHRRFYANGCRVGSPPDDFAPGGQDWSFPPPSTTAHYDDGYRLFVESIRGNIRHGGALRIDHVMRFFHLFWIPDGQEAKNGIYVKDRHEDLLHILALESVRNHVLLIGEDLGTVTDEIRDTLARFGVLSYRLFYFERHQDGSFKRPAEYTHGALVSASTHDLPTLAGFWLHRDVDARYAAGVLPDEAAYRAQLEDRAREKQKILDLLWAERLLPDYYSRNAADIAELTGELHWAIVRFLCSTPAKLMLMSEEDLMKQVDQQNLPGTTAEYPNWRHKTRYTLEEMHAGGMPNAFAHMYRDCLRATGRARPMPT
jgi:4-alpha-glucanotransferase